MVQGAPTQAAHPERGIAPARGGHLRAASLEVFVRGSIGPDLRNPERHSGPRFQAQPVVRDLLLLTPGCCVPRQRGSVIPPSSALPFRDYPKALVVAPVACYAARTRAHNERLVYPVSRADSKRGGKTHVRMVSS